MAAVRAMDHHAPGSDRPSAGTATRGYQVELTQARAHWLSLAALIGMTIGAGWWFVAFALGRWGRYETNAYDLGFFDQLTWNIAHGRPGDSTFLSYNFFGQHLEPVLFLFAVPYRLWGAGPETLLVTQAVVAALAAVPLWFAARRLGLAPVVALAAAFAYLANPYLHRAIAADFHPEVMLALPLFSALWALAAGKPRLAAGLALSGVLLKEDATLAAFGCAGLIAWQGHRRVGAATAVSAVAYAIAAIALMTLFRGGEGSDLAERYRNLTGDGLLLIPANVLSRIVSPARLLTALTLVAVSAPFVLRRPQLLLLATPPLLLALLSTHPPQRQLELHYAATTLPVLVAAGLVAAARARQFAAPAVAALILAPALAGAALWSPLVPWNAAGTPPTNEHRAAVAEALALVPRDGDVTVAAQSGLLPRLSQRRTVHEFPPFATSVDWVVVDRYGHRSSQSVLGGFDVELEHVRETYERVYSRDGVEVFRRQAP